MSLSGADRSTKGSPSSVQVFRNSKSDRTCGRPRVTLPPCIGAFAIPMRAQICFLLAAVACAICAAPAFGAATISGSDRDVWNAATPPTYVITGSAPGVELHWVLLKERRVVPTGGELINTATSPVTVSLPGLADGDQYRLWAFQTGQRPVGPAHRDFAVDATPPRVVIATPAPGAVYAQGQAVVADYRCDERMCVGPVPDGGLVPTATPGVQSFSVTATDRAGNMVTVQRDYTVGGSGVPLTPAPLVPTTPVAVAAPPVTGVPAALPPPENARRLRPRLGAKIVSTRPVLRWRALKDAKFYNVQVFRLVDKRLIKVLSAFPRANHVRVPPGRLTPGATHIWRVWPMVGEHYTPKPLGISNFEVRSKAAPRS
jgi:hypothetical protein